MSAPLNLIGVRFDKLLVTGLAGGTPSGRRWVCKCDWDDYSVFETWALAHGYDDTLVIERRDASKNYEPSNCEWITKSENSRRAATTRKVRT